MKTYLLRALGWLVLIGAALFFLAAGGRKLFNDPSMIALFRDLGYPDWFRYVVGAAEAVLAILLLVPRTSLLAAAGFIVLMTGAAVSELLAGNGFQAGVAGQWLILFIVIAIWKIRARRTR